MKIEIFKKEHDENIYFSYEDCKDNILNFDNLKELSKLILEKKKNKESIKFEIDADKELSLYKSTVEEIVNSIDEDKELLNLYIEKTKDTNITKEETD
jgi:hypothetical protein